VCNSAPTLESWIADPHTCTQVHTWTIAVNETGCSEIYDSLLKKKSKQSPRTNYKKTSNEKGIDIWSSPTNSN